MEERKLNEKESLELIAQMIQNTKNRLETNCGMPFLFWGYTTLFVEDTGSGISEDAQKHIFERFYKEDSFTQGAGLGLSICQTIVDRLHGSISVSSELGKGTRFEVVIPDANE